VGLTMSTTRRALAVGIAGATLAAPAVASNSYNVTAEARIAPATKVTRTSAQLNGFVQNAGGQKSRLVFRIGKKSYPAGKWSTSRLPRKVSTTARGLTPRTRYRVTAHVQAYVLRKKGPGGKFMVRSRPAGSVSFTTKG
jgi:hypothetical protein